MGLTETNLIPYCVFLSGLITNHDFDKYLRQGNDFQLTCPCSKKYGDWMTCVGIDDTICISTKNHGYKTIGGFMSHLLDVGMGKSNRTIELHHYLIACYMYQVYGNKIGDSAIHRINGTDNKKKNTSTTSSFYSNTSVETRKRFLSCK